MQYDPNNLVIKLCAEGMELEGKGKLEEANNHFLNAWNIAANDFEKFTAAHYVARHQKTVTDKLKWDIIALDTALKINDETVKAGFPSLYLNIAKCYEELDDFINADKNYQLALSFTSLLPEDGYGNMVRGGIKNGLERLACKASGS